jgi:hypothetical protein
MGIAGIYAGMLFPPAESSVGIGFQDGWGLGLSGIFLVAVLSIPPYLLYMLWVRRWTVALGTGIAMFIATGLILESIWHDEHSTAALGLFWFPIALFPLVLVGWVIEKLGRLFTRSSR